MSVIKLKGIVLNEIKKGEADKLLTLFTLEQGKTYVYAKGARKLKSRYFSGSSQFDYSEFVVFAGKGFYSATQIDKIEGFKNIYADYEKLLLGNYFLEIVDKTTYPSESSENLLKLLIYSLRALERGSLDNSSIARAFEFKYMQLYGYSPNLSYCSQCANIHNDNVLYFGIEGLLCQNCASQNPSACKINQHTLQAINYILNSEIKTAFNFKLDKTSKKLLKQASDIFILNLDVSLNAKAFIDYL